MLRVGVSFLSLQFFGIGAGVGTGLDRRIYRFVRIFRTSFWGMTFPGLHGVEDWGGGRKRKLKHIGWLSVLRVGSHRKRK